MNSLIIVIGVLFLFVVIFLAKSVLIVKQAEVIVVERLGKFHRVLSSGLNFIIPIIDRKRSFIWKYTVQGPDGRTLYLRRNIDRVDLRESVYDFPKQHVITKDNVTMEINALLYFQIMDPMKSVYEIYNLPEAIEKLTQTTLRNVIGELELDQALVSRDTINHKLRNILDDATDKWGVKVNRVELQDIVPPAAIRDAMEQQMKAERNKRAVILNAEGDKQSKILTAQGARDSEVARAEGYKVSIILKAEGEAESRMKIAEAEAKSMNYIMEVLKNSDKNAINYMLATRYLDYTKYIADGKDNKLVFMPYEASSMISSLGGIKELFNNIK